MNDDQVTMQPEPEPGVVSDATKAAIRPGVTFFLRIDDSFFFGREFMVTYVTETLVSFKDLAEDARKNSWVKFDGGSSASWLAFEAWLNSGVLNITGETPGYVHEIPYPTHNSVNGIEVPGVLYTRPTYGPEVAA
jgi:hypothetical protein